MNRSQGQILPRLTRAYRTTFAEALQVATATLPMNLQINFLGTKYWLEKNNSERASRIIGRRAEDNNQLTEEINNDWNRLHKLHLNVTERFSMKDLIVAEGLMHFLKGHGPYR